MKNKAVNIQEIVQGCINGNGNAQRELYNLFVDRLYNVIYRMTYHKEDTRDILQSSFIRIFNNIEKYDSSKGHVYSWMTRVSINTALSEFRKKRIVLAEAPEGLVVVDQSFTIEANLDAEYILELLQKLPKVQSLVFNLFEIEGYSHKEIGEMLEIGESSSRTYLTRAKKKLRELIIEKNHSSKSFIR